MLSLVQLILIDDSVDFKIFIIINYNKILILQKDFKYKLINGCITQT